MILLARDICDGVRTRSHSWSRRCGSVTCLFRVRPRFGPNQTFRTGYRRGPKGPRNSLIVLPERLVIGQQHAAGKLPFPHRLPPIGDPAHLLLEAMRQVVVGLLGEIPLGIIPRQSGNEYGGLERTIGKHAGVMMYAGYHGLSGVACMHHDALNSSLGQGSQNIRPGRQMLLANGPPPWQTDPASWE